MLHQPPTIPSLHKYESPRKKKGQISFAPTNFSLDLDSIEDSNNKKTAEDVKFLTSQLQKVKKERDLLQKHCESLELKLKSVHQHATEVLTRRQLEEQSFRSSLQKAKAAFDNKIVKLSIKAKDREELLLDWLTTVDDLSLYPSHPSLQELRARTLHQLPPSLREIMRGPRSRQTAGASHTHTATGKSKRGKRTVKHKIIHKKTSLASSTDPDALLAIINENINVLDHFNLLHLQSDKEREDSDVSDIDDAVAMIRGGYSEYMHSAHNAEVAQQSGVQNYSRLAAPHAHTVPTAAVEVSSLQQELGPQPHRPASKVGTSSSRQGSRSGRAAGVGSPSSRGGSGRTGPRRPIQQSRSPSRTGTGAGGRPVDDDGDSVGSGTVTGSIMDHNDALSSDDEEQRHRLHIHTVTAAPDIVEQQLEEDDAGLYDVSLWSHPLSLTAPAPGHHLSAGQRSREGIQEGQQEQQMPRTPRSTAVPAVPTSAAAVSSDQFTAAMQGLHDLGTTVATGGGEAAVARAEQHRRMSQMSTNYTDMVRNILDSVSELSRSYIAEETGLETGEAEGVTQAPTVDKDRHNRHTAGRRSAPGLGTERSGIEADLADLMQQLGVADDDAVSADGSPPEFPPAVQCKSAALPTTPAAAVASSSSVEQQLSLNALLLQAGVTLDALSSGTEHETGADMVYTPFTQDGAEAALSLATDANINEQQQQQGAIVYSEQDIERIINTATSLDDDSELEESGNEHSGQQKRTRKKGRGAGRKKAGGGTAKQGSSSSRVSTGEAAGRSGSGGSRSQQRSAAGSRGSSEIEYSMDFESERGHSQQHSEHSHRSSSSSSNNKHATTRSNSPRSSSRAAAEAELKLGGDWDNHSEYTTTA